MNPVRPRLLVFVPQSLCFQRKGPIPIEEADVDMSGMELREMMEDAVNVPGGERPARVEVKLEEAMTLLVM